MINGRSKGHAFERKIVKELRDLGYEAVTSRSENRALDDQGVDIVDNTPYFIQCKAVENLHGLSNVLKKMPDGKPPVIVHKRNNQPVMVYQYWTDFKLKMKTCDIKEKAVKEEMSELRDLLKEVFHDYLGEIDSKLIAKIHTKLYKNDNFKF